MCDELIEAYSKLKKDITLCDDDRKYIEQANVYVIRKRSYGDEFYKWKTYNELTFYKNYDGVDDYIGRHHKGKRILNKEIRVSGLPEHCYK